MKIYITGVSGVGKSTLIKELNKKGLLSFDVDSIHGLCHWRNKKTGKKAHHHSGIGKDWLDAHNYICNLKKLKKLINKKPLVAVAGVVSNQKEVLKLFDKMFLLHCKEKVFLKRLSIRTNNDFAKDKTEQRHVLSWYKEFEKEMLAKGAIPLDTSKDSQKIIAKKLIKYIKKDG